MSDLGASPADLRIWWRQSETAVVAPNPDGRLARSERTKRRIVKAALQIISAGSNRLTTGAIARQARISPRTFFVHYGDLEALLAEATEPVARKYAELLVPVPGDLALPDRIASFVRDQSRIFEGMGGFHRSIRKWRDRSAVVAARYECYQAANRARLEASFAAELATLDMTRRRWFVEALIALTGWEYWQELRHRAGMDVDDAQRALIMAVQCLFAGALDLGARVPAPLAAE